MYQNKHVHLMKRLRSGEDCGGKNSSRNRYHRSRLFTANRQLEKSTVRAEIPGVRDLFLLHYGGRRLLMASAPVATSWKSCHERALMRLRFN